MERGSKNWFVCAHGGEGEGEFFVYMHYSAKFSDSPKPFKNWFVCAHGGGGEVFLSIQPNSLIPLNLLKLVCVSMAEGGGWSFCVHALFSQIL